MRCPSPRVRLTFDVAAVSSNPRCRHQRDESPRDCDPHRSGDSGCRRSCSSRPGRDRDQEIAGVPEQRPRGAVAFGVRPARWNRNDSGKHVSAEYKTVQLYAADVANCARKNGRHEKGLQSGGHLDQAESNRRQQKAFADEGAPARGDGLGGAVCLHDSRDFPALTGRDRQPAAVRPWAG